MPALRQYEVVQLLDQEKIVLNNTNTSSGENDQRSMPLDDDLEELN
jgi:hypothetical protein